MAQVSRSASSVVFRRSVMRPFPGHLFVNQRLAKFMEEGGKIYSCRFSDPGALWADGESVHSGHYSDQSAGCAGLYPPAQKGGGHDY